jgi:hypothetical protein
MVVRLDSWTNRQMRTVISFPAVWEKLLIESNQERCEMVWQCSTTMQHHTQPRRPNNGSSSMGGRCCSILYAVCTWYPQTGPLKWHLSGPRFVNKDDVIAAGMIWLQVLHQDVFAKSFNVLVSRWVKCLSRGGEMLWCLHVCKQLYLCGNKCCVTVSLHTLLLEHPFCILGLYTLSTTC